MDPPDSTDKSFNEILNPHVAAQYDEVDDFFKELNSFIDTSNENKDIAVCADQMNNSGKEHSYPMDSEEHTESQEFKMQMIPEPDIIEDSLIERLKQQNKKLKDTIIQQERVLLNYETQLSIKMHEFANLEMEKNVLNDSVKSTNIEKIKLQQELELKEAQLKQFKDFSDKQFNDRQTLGEVKKELEAANKKCERYERDLQHSKNMWMDNKKICRDLKLTNKKILNTLFEFGKILKCEGLLSPKMEKALQNFQDKAEPELNDSCSEENLAENEHLDGWTDKINSVAATQDSSSFEELKDDISDPNGEFDNNEIIDPSVTSLSKIKVSTPNYHSESESSLSLKKRNSFCIFQNSKNQDICRVGNTMPNDKFSNGLIDKTSNASPDSNFLNLKSESASPEEISNEKFEEVQKGIMGLVLKTEDFAPLSPLPPSPPPKYSSEYVSKDIAIDNNENVEDSVQFQSVECSSKQINMSESMSSTEYSEKRNIFSHQTSKGFEPHIEECVKNMNSSKSQRTPESVDISHTLIPPNLHYICSTYSNEDNNFKILHQGNSVYDYLVNPENKLSVCVLTLPKKDSFLSKTCSTASSQNISILPSKEKRMQSVLSLYHATEKRVSAVSNFLSQDNGNNSVNDNLSHISIVVDGKNELINSTYKFNNSCLPLCNDSLEGKKAIDVTMEDECGVAETVEQQNNENQPYVSSSCDVSPSKRKFLSKSFRHPESVLSKLTEKDQYKDLPVVKTTQNYNGVTENTHSTVTLLNEEKIDTPSKIIKLNRSPLKNQSFLFNVDVESEISDMNLKKYTSTPIIEHLSAPKNTCKINTSEKEKSSAFVGFNINTTSEKINSSHLNESLSPIVKDEVECISASSKQNHSVVNNSHDISVTFKKSNSDFNKTLIQRQNNIEKLETSDTTNEEIADANMKVPKSENVKLGPCKTHPITETVCAMPLIQESPLKQQKCAPSEIQSKSRLISELHMVSTSATLENLTKKSPEKSVLQHSSPKTETSDDCNKNKLIHNISEDTNITDFKIVDQEGGRNSKLLNMVEKPKAHIQESPLKQQKCAPSTEIQSKSRLISELHMVSTSDTLANLTKEFSEKSVPQYSSPKTETSDHCNENKLIHNISEGTNITGFNNINEEGRRNSELLNIVEKPKADNQESPLKQQKLLQSFEMQHSLNDVCDQSSTMSMLQPSSSKIEDNNNFSENKLADYFNDSKCYPYSVEENTNSNLLLTRESADCVGEDSVNTLIKNTADCVGNDSVNTLIKNTADCVGNDSVNTLIKNTSAVETKNTGTLDIQKNGKLSSKRKKRKRVRSKKKRVLKKKNKVSINQDSSNLVLIKSSENVPTGAKNIESFNKGLSVKVLTHSERKFITEKNSVVNPQLQNSDLFKNSICAIQNGDVSQYSVKAVFKTSVNKINVKPENSICSQSESNSLSNSAKTVIISKDKVPESATNLKSESSEIIKIENEDITNILPNSFMDTQTCLKTNMDKNKNSDILTETVKLVDENCINNSKTVPVLSNLSDCNVMQPLNSSLLNMSDTSSKSELKNDLKFKDVIHSPTLEIKSEIFKTIPNKDSNVVINQNNLAFRSVNEECSENVPHSNGISESNILPVSNLSNSVENKVMMNPYRQELKNARRNSCQSSISEDENPLVIVEDIEEKNISDPEIKEEIKSNVKSRKKKPKKRKSTKVLENKRKRYRSSNEDESCNIVLSITKVLEEIESAKIQDSLTIKSHFKLHVHTLVNVLINPSNAPNTSSALYQVFKHVCSSRLNPLLSFSKEQNSSVFLPFSEKCIVLALIQVEAKKKNHLKGLISTAITVLFSLVLGRKNIAKTGLGALCRIFTQLCKHISDKQNPIKLCCELLKMKHPLAPYLIASIAGVWNELFAVSDDMQIAERLLHECIVYGIQIKPETLNSNDWKLCKILFSNYLVSPSVSDVTNAALTLIDVLEDIFNEKPCDTDFMVLDSFAILCAFQDSSWIQDNVLGFVISRLQKYACQEKNERAYSLLCELVAEIGLSDAGYPEANRILHHFFNEIETDNYVKDCAARCLLKLYLLRKIDIPVNLHEWVQENQYKLAGTPIEFQLKRRLISDVTTFTETDIICVC